MFTGWPSLVLATTASVSLALSACGGGGGGGSTTPPGDGSTMSPSIEETFADSTKAANLAVAMRSAARALPRPGSVTQSSNVDNNNTTTDRVQITAEYGAGGPVLSVRNGAAWSITGEDDDVVSKRIAGGTLYVGAYSDIEPPSTRQVGGGDDGTQDIPLGTMILGAGVTISAGGGIAGQRGALDGEPGTFNCTGGCAVSGGTTTRGMWTFTPDRPPGAVDVSSSDAVAWSGSFNRDRLPGTRNGQQGYFRCLSQSCGHSTSTVSGRTRMMLSGVWIFVSSTTTTVTEPDDDYLALGIWLVVPDNAASAADYVFGAFADGNDPFLQSNLAAVAGTATYDGDASGVYSEKSAGTTEIGNFEGDIRLMADFGDANGLGTISGSVTNIEAGGDTLSGMLHLGSADIGAQNSGFFRGQASGTVEQRGYTGQWGGQFFGNGEPDGRPGSVAGTFGGYSTDDAVNFVGVFDAHKQ